MLATSISMSLDLYDKFYEIPIFSSGSKVTIIMCLFAIDLCESIVYAVKCSSDLQFINNSLL